MPTSEFRVAHQRETDMYFPVSHVGAPGRVKSKGVEAAPGFSAQHQRDLVSSHRLWLAEGVAVEQVHQAVKDAAIKAAANWAGWSTA